MTIVKAGKKHKEQTLELLDNFRTACARIINPEKEFISTSAKDFGKNIYKDVINSNDSAIFLAEEDNKYIGIITIHKVPCLRKGTFYGEIEEMFVEEKYRGTGVAKQLMEVAEKWAKDHNLRAIYLKSGIELERAHNFYKKVGFREYAKGYEKIL